MKPPPIPEEIAKTGTFPSWAWAFAGVFAVVSGRLWAMLAVGAAGLLHYFFWKRRH